MGFTPLKLPVNNLWKEGRMNLEDWYIYQALATWFVGFFPYFEIYLAVPAGIAMGYDLYFMCSFPNPLLKALNNDR
jgi:hypothetical protein